MLKIDWRSIPKAQADEGENSHRHWNVFIIHCLGTGIGPMPPTCMRAISEIEKLNKTILFYNLNKFHELM